MFKTKDVGLSALAFEDLITFKEIFSHPLDGFYQPLNDRANYGQFSVILKAPPYFRHEFSAPGAIFVLNITVYNQSDGQHLMYTPSASFFRGGSVWY